MYRQVARCQQLKKLLDSGATLDYKMHFQLVMQALQAELESLNLEPLSPEQENYQEPFGIDKMYAEQWLLFIYLPAIIADFAWNDYTRIRMANFSYYFALAWKDKPQLAHATVLVELFEMLAAKL